MADSMDRLAVIAGDGVLTHRALGPTADRVAARLLNGSADLNEARVAYLVAPGCAHVAVALGIWRAGGIAVPLNASHSIADVAYILDDASVSCLVTDEASAHLIPSTVSPPDIRVLAARDVVSDASATTATLPHVARERRAMIVYTSGTTGRPKGVVLTHTNLTAQIDAQITAWGWTPDDRILHVLPLHHLHGVINAMHTPLGAGAACEFVTKFDPLVVWRRFASGEITVFTAVPTIYQRLIDCWEAASADDRRAWSQGVQRLRLMMCGSAALPTRVIDRWHEITGHTLLERYGMTETGMVLSNPLDGERRRGFVGLPLPDVAVTLIGDGGLPTSTGTPGEIHVKGPGVFSEYWRRPAETAAAFVDGWFKTGDTAVLEDNSYRILGRNSTDIIKTGGYKVSALEIEEVLRTHPDITECAVVGVPDRLWGERVCAVVELRNGGVLSLEQLQQWAKPRLASYKVPKTLKAVGALPRNALGKVIKGDVRAGLE
jgi:malonyl-CoA/methylmalonyl-CoA synthetase